MWLTVELGDICDVLDRLRKPITKRDRVSGNIPYYGATGIVDYVADYIFDERLVLVGEDGAKWDAGERTAFIIEGKTWVNNHAHVLRPHADKVLHEWLAYYLTGIDVSAWVTGLTVPKLNQAQLRSIPIPLPPLSEQQRIVDKLDAAFAEIDAATSVKQQQINEAKLLRVSARRDIITSHSTSMISHSLGDLFKFSSGNFLPKKQMNNDGQFDVYGGNGIAGKHDQTNLTGPNILVGRVGAKCGNVHYVDDDIWLTDNAMYVHSYKQEFDLQFLTLVLDGLKLGQYARQAAQPVISFSSVQDVKVSFPTSIDEQREIFEVIDSCDRSIDEIVNASNNSLKELSSLKFAILAQELQSEAA